tara:strand:+ start:45 stop:368 length:324 start_codon:yes stop_codon:yes gene_type:complete
MQLILTGILPRQAVTEQPGILPGNGASKVKSKIETRRGVLISEDGDFVSEVLYDVILDFLPTGDVNERAKRNFKLPDGRSIMNTGGGKFAITNKDGSQTTVHLSSDD